jgi:hypothetical protein
MKRWQDWVNAVLGVALIASPWILGFAQARGVAAWGAWILGGLIVIVALASQLIPAAWGEAFMLLFGICSIVSPWVLGYSAESRPTSSAVILGVLVAAATTALSVLEVTIWHGQKGKQ